MKFKWLSRGAGDTATVFFAGFACDAAILSKCSLPKTDVCVVFDYRDFSLSENFSRYAKVRIVAWSFGVKVADVATADWANVVSRIAICGSTFPVDDTLGIPRAVFEKTLENFDAAGVEKFYKRVCGARNFAQNRAILCSRTPDELRDELRSCGRFFDADHTVKSRWDCAFACVGDKIFPTRNLARTFPKNLTVWEGEHLSPELFDYALNAFHRGGKLASAFEKSADSYEKCAVVQKNVGLFLREKLQKLFPERKFKRAFEFGCGTGFLTSQIKKHIACESYVVNDISPALCLSAANASGARACFGPVEKLALAQLSPKPDLILSASCLQWIDARPRLYKRLFDASESGAVLALGTFGEGNFPEFSELGIDTLEYDSFETFTSEIAAAGFEIAFCANETFAFSFASVRDILRHIKNTGVHGEFASFWTPQKLRRFETEYTRRFGDSGGVRLTYNPMTAIAVRK